MYECLGECTIQLVFSVERNKGPSLNRAESIKIGSLKKVKSAQGFFSWIHGTFNGKVNYQVRWPHSRQKGFFHLKSLLDSPTQSLEAPITLLILFSTPVSYEAPLCGGFGPVCFQSINQSELSLRQYPWRRPGSVVHQTNQCPKAKIQDSVQKRCQQTIGCAGIYGGKAKSKRCVFRCLLKVVVEGANRTKRRNLFHRLGLQEWKAFAPVLVLTLGTEKWIPLLDLSGWGGINGVSMAFK